MWRIHARNQCAGAVKERLPAGYDELVADVAEEAPGFAGRLDHQDDCAMVMYCSGTFLSQYLSHNAVSVCDRVSDLIEMVLEIWSEWQDLNLRPPRPERGDFMLNY